MTMYRRRFLKSTAYAGISMAVAGRHALGANNDIRMAVIGVGGKGGGHLQAFSKINPDSEELKKLFKISVKYTALLIVPASNLIAIYMKRSRREITLLGMYSHRS